MQKGRHRRRLQGCLLQDPLGVAHEGTPEPPVTQPTTESPPSYRMQLPAAQQPLSGIVTSTFDGRSLYEALNKLRASTSVCLCKQCYLVSTGKTHSCFALHQTEAAIGKALPLAYTTLVPWPNVDCTASSASIR